jgi:prepilin-type N-terminal cleavage/methylation domain-containing protein
MTMNNRNLGFTLIELLVAMAIFGVLTVSVLSLLGTFEGTTAFISAQSRMQGELRDAAAIIADEVQRAYYVFPPCGAYTTDPDIAPTKYACSDTLWTGYISGRMNVNFSKIKLAASGTTTLRPDSTTFDTANPRTWTVGDTNAPILAMITAPREPQTSSCTGVTTSEQSKGCYMFVAYFPVLRSSVTRTSPTDISSDKLEPDAKNSNQWVLMEYREIINDKNVGGLTVTAPTVGSLNIPVLGWDYVGCEVVSSCSKPSLNGASADPKTSVQTSDGNLPSIFRGATDLATLARFTAKMYYTVQQFGQGQANILMTNVEPLTGFQVTFPTKTPVSPAPAICVTLPNDLSCFTGVNTIDERGATEIRVRLQAGLVRSLGLSKSLYPAQPLEVFITPRNLSAAYSGK